MGCYTKILNACFLGGTFFSRVKPELEANVFAAELLISDNTILENPGLNKKQLAGLIGYREKLFDFKQDVESNSHYGGYL